MIGQTISHYRILEKLGEGGMGIVYKAHDTTLERDVALKFLPAHLSASEQDKARFMQEAKAAATLDHPNICTIHSIEEHDKQLFIAMQFVDGQLLRDRMSGLGQKQALEIGIQVAEGLAAAHEKGVVHRDIKPENIMVRKDGIAQIMDFGLAKVRGGSQLTKAGSTVGTIGYMSPEQIQGIDVDHRADIFSLGVLLYEMTTGTPPFRGEHDAAIMYEIVNVQPRDPGELKPGISPELVRIISKCLAKDPEERYHSAKDIAVDLRVLSRRSGSSPQQGTPQPGSKNRTSQSGKMPPWRTAGISGLALLAVGLLALFLFSEEGEVLDSLAVLPFENVAKEQEMEYLSDGITESLINSLSQLSQLRVMSRSSVFRFKGGGDPQEAGKELGVRAVLTGRVLQRGDDLIISTELTDVADNSNLWGEQYNRKAADILAVQEEITREIMQNLRLRLADKDAQRLAERPTGSTEAYQIYLKGRYHWNKRSVDGIRRSIEYFRQAVDEDPNFALAYSGMADAYGVYGWFEYGVISPLETYPKALEAARRALEIDPDRGESHASLAFAKLVYTYDHASVDEGFKRSIALNPSYPTAHQWYAEYLTSQGELDKGVEVMKHALTLDPLSLIITRDVGWMLYFARRYDEANEYFLKALELDPNFMRAHLILGQSYLHQGLFEKAQKAFETAELLSQGTVSTIMLGYCHAKAGRAHEARRILDSLLTLSSTKYVPPGSLALLYDALGDRDKSFAWLNKAADEHSGVFMFIRVDPFFDGMRNDPRYADLLRRVGLSG